MSSRPMLEKFLADAETVNHAGVLTNPKRWQLMIQLREPLRFASFGTEEAAATEGHSASTRSQSLVISKS